MMKVNFYYPYPDEWALINGQGLNAPAEWFQHYPSRRHWTVRVYLLLKKMGCEVGMVQTWPEDGLLVAYSDDAKKLWRTPIPRRRALTVVSRADTEPNAWADFEILQNGKFARPGHCWHLPHLPQPGLLCRNPDRGERIERITYKGDSGNLHQAFRDKARWDAALERRGMQFECDDTNHHTKNPSPISRDVRWYDYTHTDLTLSVRPLSRCNYVYKPASKLINAWLAGAPAILGPDHAFRELRQDPLDYIEVQSPEEALEQIDRLREHPSRYRAMIEQGHKRAAAFTEQATTRRWHKVLFEEIPIAAKQLDTRARTSLPARVRPYVNLACRREWGGFGRRKALAAVRRGLCPSGSMD